MNGQKKWNISYDRLFFLFSCFVSVIITYFITGTCIDSDASSELVLSNHLAETGKILSEEWGYSTELRVLNTQLVYAPLFWIFDDWHMVRYLGALILQAILVLSFYAFVRLLDIDRKIFFLSAGLYLLPISVCYGRIVLYNSYYVPHISISLLIVGLIFAKNTNEKILSCCARIIALFALSFLGGMGGIRQLLMTHAPVLLAVFIFFFVDDFIIKGTSALKDKSRIEIAVNSVLSFGFFYLGYLVNKQYFMKKYIFSDYSASSVELLEADGINDVLYGFFHHFGLRENATLMSVLGVLSVVGIVLGATSLIIAFWGLKKYVSEKNIQRAMPCVFYIAYVAVMLLVFFVLGRGFYYVLYFSPVVVWMIPVFAEAFVNIQRSLPIINLRRALPVLAVLAIGINGAVNSVYFLDDKRFEQKYEGLVFQDRSITKTLDPVVDFLVENEYELGYATFWNANIITEMSDGKARFINVHFNDTTGKVTFNYWLTLTANRNLENPKKFLLLERYQQKTFENGNDLTDCSLVYEDENYVVYEIKNH